MLPTTSSFASRPARIIAAALVMFLPLISACAVNKSVDPSLVLRDAQLLIEVRNVLHNGDWLVTRGVHGTDDFVASATNLALSHAGVYDLERDEVIEAEAKGVHATPLPEFLGKSHRVLVLRPMWATSASTGPAVAAARAAVGKGYNFTGLAGVNTPERYYCTQLAIAVYTPFMDVPPDNPIPPVIHPGRMFHWGRILYDSGPFTMFKRQSLQTAKQARTEPSPVAPAQQPVGNRHTP